MPTLCHVMPTKWRSYRDHRFCDVTSPYMHACMEQFAGHCHIVAIAADIQETTQYRTVCSQLSRLLAAATSDTCFFFFFPRRSHVSFTLFFFARCPRSLWHYATLISSFNNNNNNNSNAFLSCYNASTLCFCTTLCQLTCRTSDHPTFWF